jgi:hypothetical protein
MPMGRRISRRQLNGKPRWQSPVKRTLLMTAWGCVLRNPWLAAGIMSFLYGFGLAAWDEGEDTRVRFGRSKGVTRGCRLFSRSRQTLPLQQ